MSDENATHDQPGKPSNGDPGIQGAKPVKSPSSTPAQAANEFQDVKKELGGYERSTLKLTMIIVGINALTCLFIALQWHEMKSGSADTHAVAEAAKKQSEKMSNMSDAANEIRQAAQDMVIQDQRIADNAKNSLDASNRQSKAALDATIANARLDQRPYLVLDGSPQFLAGQPAADGQPIKANVWIKNIGKAPAIKGQLSVSLLPYHPTSTVQLVDFLEGTVGKLRDNISLRGNPYAKLVRHDIAPQDRMFSTAQTDPLTADDAANLKTGNVTLFCIGLISYYDSGGVAYETQFCNLYFGAAPNTWHICDSHNVIQ
jgi:hypothetical protein